MFLQLVPIEETFQELEGIEGVQQKIGCPLFVRIGITSVVLGLQKLNLSQKLYSLLAPHFGVIPINISKLIPGIGRESTERYSSLKRLLIVPFSDRSAHLNASTFSSEMFDIKYDGSLPVSVISFEDIVNRSE